MSAMRLEHDLVGEIAIPSEAYWGIHAARAAENFPISGIPIGHYRSLIRALATVKHAAALANFEVGELAKDKLDLIVAASVEVAQGQFDSEFIVDAIQGGAGTSTNMNANEVIANRALELGGWIKGEYEHIHPLNDVNMSQSTNDVYPTALKLALILEIRELITAMEYLRSAFTAKAIEFKDVIKMGRTQLQDAVPMTLGQEFASYSRMIMEDIQRLQEVIPLLSEINLGGTAIGTQLNAPKGYAAAACRALSELTSMPFVVAADMVEATQDAGVFVMVSGVLKRVAVKLSKTSNDLRLLSSGPRAGFGEINLPPRQAGSSIMPGKVNPVVPEVVNQVAFSIIGADATVTAAVEAGQLQLNAFEPVIASSILQSFAWMTNACRTLRINCVNGITANRDRLEAMVATSVGVITALIPVIGYEEAAKLAKKALATGAPIRELVVEAGLMSAADVDAALSPDKLSNSSN